MTACDSCSKVKSDRCPLFQSRHDETRQARIALAMLRYMSTQNRCPHHQRCDPNACVYKDREAEHCYNQAIQTGQRDMFEANLKT